MFVETLWSPWALDAMLVAKHKDDAWLLGMELGWKSTYLQMHPRMLSGLPELVRGR